MRKYKQFIVGVIVGAMMFSLVPISAAIEEYICYKADYKLVIQGAEYTNTDLPILNYKGSTYGPLRPMLEAAGLTVEWNAELGQAEVNTATLQTTNETGVESMTTDTESTVTYVEKDAYQLAVQDGKEYMFVYDFYTTLLPKYGTENGLYRYSGVLNSVVYVDKGKDSRTDIITNIPTTKINNKAHIEYDYIVNTVIPELEKGR